MVRAYKKKNEMWYEPADFARSNLKFECEMSRDDHGFLCGLLKEKHPSVIMEIGVAEGGTTLVIDTAMKMLGIVGKLFSIDISKELYCDRTKGTGFIYKESEKHWLEHEFIFGHTVADFIRDTKEIIDFVVLDTTHIVPGELLDFLAILPYLNNGTTVVLHDVFLNIARGLCNDPTLVSSSPWSIATKLLYSSVSGIKYSSEKNNSGEYVNISAFEITEQTREQVYNVFFALTHTWQYIPADWQIGEYKMVFGKEYDDECNRLFEYALESNKKIKKNESYYNNQGFHIPFREISYNSKVLLYGAGMLGRLIFREINETKYCRVVAWVDRNYEKMGSQIENPEMVFKIDYDFVLIAIEDISVYQSVRKALIERDDKLEKKILSHISIHF